MLSYCLLDDILVLVRTSYLVVPFVHTCPGIRRNHSELRIYVFPCMLVHVDIIVGWCLHNDAVANA
jgi:hypothetical protein